MEHIQDIPQYNEYDEMTEFDWVEYEFATIEHDYRVHPKAVACIREMFKRLYNANPR